MTLETEHHPAATTTANSVTGGRALGRWLRADWRQQRFAAWGAGVALLTSLITVAVYLNTPHPVLDPDTPAYLAVAQRILTHGQLVDATRLPGYPLLVAGTFAVAGNGNLTAVWWVQAALFLVATIEVYVLGCLLLQHAWAAALLAALVGANVYILSYVQPVLSEAFALALLTTLALAVALYVRRPGARRLWAVAAVTLALFMTRPEWIYVPVPLFAFLLAAAWQRGLARRLAPHAVLAVLALYAVLGLYIHANSVQHHFNGITSISNINILGKVMQYHMQDEAPPQYHDLTQLVDGYMARGDLDPWNVIRSQYPPLTRDYFALAARYGSAIIEHHPVQFAADSVGVGIQSLAQPERIFRLDPHGALARPLTTLEALATALMRVLVLFPLLGVAWWALWLHRRHRAPDARDARTTTLVTTMAGLALLGAYGLVITTCGGYVYYGRLHTPFDPLLIVVVYGSALLAFSALRARLRTRQEGTIADV